MELIDLPVEVHAMIIAKIDSKDLFNLSRVSKYFFMLCNDNKRYERKIVQSRRLVSFDSDFFGLISGELTYLYEGLKEIIRPIFNYRAFLFSVMKKKLQNVAYKLLPFIIYNHLFCCLWEAEPQEDVGFAHNVLLKILTKHHILILILL